MIGSIENDGFGAAAKWWALFVFAAINVLLTFFPNKKLLPYMSVRLIYWAFTVFTAIAGVVIVGLSFVWDLSVFSIQLSDLINNLVGALLAAIIVVAWLRSTDMSTRSSSSRKNWEVEKQGFISKKAGLILETLGDQIRRAANENTLDPSLILAIVVYEDLNRPKFIRRLENLLIRIPGLRLTVGIAQVRSSTPLTDEESINRLGQILRSPDLSSEKQPSLQALRAALIDYNGSKAYASNVIEIYKMLSPLARERFEQSGDPINLNPPVVSVAHGAALQDLLLPLYRDAKMRLDQLTSELDALTEARQSDSDDDGHDPEGPPASD